MSFEEKKSHPLLIVQPENHGSRMDILIPAELLQHMAASLALSPLLRCWRLLPRGGWGPVLSCPVLFLSWGQEHRPCPLIPTCCTQGPARPSVLPLREEMPGRTSSLTGTTLSVAAGGHLLGNAFPETQNLSGTSVPLLC